MSDKSTDFMDLKPVVMPGIKPKPTLARGGAGAVASSTFRKLDEDIDGAPKQKKVDPTSRQALIKARVDKGWTQDQADTQCNFPKHTFKAIENGTLTPTGKLLSKISSVLKVDLKLI
jgi:ribosome-binding protein aMBF1 (putative translation factor)